MEENLVETTENVEQTTEEIAQPEKIYTEEELNQRIDELLPKKLNRREEKIRREYEKKYGELEDILKAGLKVDSIEQATENIKEMYQKRGIELPTTKSSLSSHQEELLATAEANELIEGSTLDEIDEEMRNLADKGVENMTSAEKIVFTKLNAYVSAERDRRELAKLGITADSLDEDYQEFAKNLNPSLSTKEKYEMYKKFRPDKPKVEPMGSMKGTAEQDKGVKEFYTYEEASQFTREDFDKNPELFKAVENSMYKWK